MIDALENVALGDGVRDLLASHELRLFQYLHGINLARVFFANLHHLAETALTDDSEQIKISDRDLLVDHNGCAATGVGAYWTEKKKYMLRGARNEWFGNQKLFHIAATGETPATGAFAASPAASLLCWSPMYSTRLVGKRSPLE